MSNVAKSKEEEKETQLTLIDRRKKQWSMTSFIISIITILIFFVVMPFLGNYLLHPSEQYKYVIPIIFLGLLLIVSVVGLIFGILAIKMGRNALNLSGLIINSFVFLANFGMIIFLIYIQLTQY